MSDLARLIEEARGATPPPVSELEAERAVRHARVTGAARHRASIVRRVAGVAAVAAAAAAAIVTFLGLPPAAPRELVAERASSEEGAPTDLELPTGDRALATDGARFTVESASATLRRIDLSSGTMLFDVRTLGGSRFEVATDEAEIVVLGTVFTVHASEGATTVRVYEGRVEVRSARGRVVRNAGDIVHVGRGAPRADALVEPARATAEARLARVRRGSGELAVAASPAGAASAEPWRADLRDGLDEEAEASPPREAPSVEPTVERAARSVERGPSQTDARPRGDVPGVERARGDVEREAASAARDGAAEPRERSAHAAPPAASEVRAWLAAGDAERALAAARDHLARGERDPWRMLEADALRAAGRADEAATAYGLAARELASPRREQAGYLEARLRQSRDALAALAALDGAGVTADGSPLRERGLSLRAQLLERLGRDAERREVARVYVRDYPGGSQAAAMRALLE